MVQDSEDNLMVGGYPEGRDWNNILEEILSPEYFRAAAQRIMMLTMPERDPVTGSSLRLDQGFNFCRRP